MAYLKSVFLLAAGVALGGCVSLAAVSAGHVGCPEDDIAISDDNPGFGTHTWTAQCHGRTFFCSAAGRSDISCKEQEAAAAAAPSAVPAVSSGCQYDTQCKGDRICRNGMCVDPTPPVNGPR